jgi:ornithine carbamoyltransferase
MAQVGGDSIYLGADVGWKTRESIEDFARVLTRYVDAVVFRGSHHTVEQLAAHASCPIINGLTDQAHPCQALADLFTIAELAGDVTSQKVVFVGDNNNVARSLAAACAMLNLPFVQLAPKGFLLDGAYLEQIRSRYPEAAVEATSDFELAFDNATFVYTDVWASMGQEADHQRRRAQFAAYQVNTQLMNRAAPGACFMHCLPARRGEEVTDEVIDGPQSVVVRQAENRLHVQKAILVRLLAGWR